MNCCSAESLIHSALDGELTPTARRELDNHLETCVDCTNLMGEHFELRGLADEWARQWTSEADPGEVVNRRVLQTVSSRQPGGEARRRRLRLLGATSSIGTVMMAVAIGFYVNAPVPHIDSLPSLPTRVNLMTDVQNQLNWLSLSLNSTSSMLSSKIIPLSLYVPLLALVLVNVVLYARGNRQTSGTT
jgi:predicted anti-sigma-YlaC factor YlaD